MATSAMAGLKQVYSGVDSIVRRVSSLAVLKIGSLIGLATAGAGIGGVAAKVLTLGAHAETTRMSFQTMLGSVQRGDAMMAKLDRFSNSTPYSGDQVNRAAKTLLGFGVAAGSVEGKLRQVGDVAAGSGKDFNELSAIYGKVFAKGKADSEVLNQLSESIPIIKLLGEQYKKSGEEIYDMASKGKISAADIDKAFAKISGKGGMYAGMMEKMSGSVSGMWAAIVGQLEYAGSLVGESIGPLVKDVLKVFVGWADELVKMAQDGRMVQYIATIAYTAIDVGATVAKVLLTIKEYGVASFGAIADFGAAVWYGVGGAAVGFFVNVMRGFNTIVEFNRAVWGSVFRLGSAAWNGLLSVTATVWAKIINTAIGGVNAVIEALNRIPGVNIELMGKPKFVDQIEAFAKESGKKAADDWRAYATGQDLTDAQTRLKEKNAAWNSTDEYGKSLIDKSADLMLSGVGRFAEASKNVEDGSKAIEGFAAKATARVEKWQADAQQKLLEQKKSTSGEKAESAITKAAELPKLKLEKIASDNLTKIGGYGNFGVNQIRSIDRERNNLLISIRDIISRFDLRGGALS